MFGTSFDYTADTPLLVGLLPSSDEVSEDRKLDTEAADLAAFRAANPPLAWNIATPMMITAPAVPKPI